ncbi:DUF3566 domain-containing protein [Streptomyces capoamus]|uniref:DUF3566 domain-containing protein n=1 Tax=Streptomyces capoamus TaxID=68183 RepID=UPI00339B682F
MRIIETNPWSVTVTSFLFLGALGACALGSVLTASVILDLLLPGAWPTPSETLFLGTVIVTLEVFLGTGLACLCSLMYNYTAQFSGGVEVALTDDLSEPTPVAQALRLMRRLHVRAWQRLYTRLPVDFSHTKRLGLQLPPGQPEGKAQRKGPDETDGAPPVIT